MAGSFDYITETTGCRYTYSLVMSDDSPVPSYFNLNSIDGSISFKNQASNAVDAYIGIVILASDGYNNIHTYRTEYFRVVSECGLRST